MMITASDPVAPLVDSVNAVSGALIPIFILVFMIGVLIKVIQVSLEPPHKRTKTKTIKTKTPVSTVNDFIKELKDVKTKAERATADYGKTLSAKKTLLEMPILLSPGYPVTATADTAIRNLFGCIHRIDDLTSNKKTPFSHADLTSIREEVTTNIKAWEDAKTQAKTVGIPILSADTGRTARGLLSTMMDKSTPANMRETARKKLIDLLHDTRTAFQPRFNVERFVDNINSVHRTGKLQVDHKRVAGITPNNRHAIER